MNATSMPQIPWEDRPSLAGDCLAFYNGPLLAWLPTMMVQELRGHRLLAMAVAEQSLDSSWISGGEGPWPFLVVTMTEEIARAMLADRITVRQAVLTAAAWHVIPRYDAPQLQWIAVTREQVMAKGDHWLPGDVMLHAD